MKEIFTAQDFTRVGFYESVLKEAGIRCFIQNFNSQYSPIALPSPHSLPRLCIIDDEDFDDAIELLEPFQNQPIPSAMSVEWKCQACGEQVPAEFDSCWKCGVPKSGNS